MRKLYSCPLYKFAGVFWLCCKNLSRWYGNAQMANLLPSYKEILCLWKQNNPHWQFEIGRPKKIPHWNFTAKSIVASGKKQSILRT